MKHCYYWPYILRTVQPLNGRSFRTEHHGALIRLENGGVACIHPWPELGDLPLGEQLESLRSGGRTPLIDAAIECAMLDGKARHEGRSLFENRKIPESHWLAMDGDVPESVMADGFRTVKLKGGPDFSLLSRKIQEWSECGFRLRIDMNESVHLSAFLGFWRSLSKQAIAAVELVEDPVLWEKQSWETLRRAGVKIAVDRDGDGRWREGDVRVYKPACQKLSSRPAGCRFFVTSYMDHAIGQFWAAWNAARASGSQSMLTCGLMTHRCFEPDDFFERIGTEGSALLAPDGTGLGFDELLKKLPWKKLI